jgi:hypothetical protein
MTAPADYAYAISETELQERIRTMCKQLGLAVQHIYDARRCWLVGYPDLTILGTSIIWRELKRQGEGPTPAQRKVGSLITAAGGDWAVWRPADLLDGTIVRQLQVIA